MSQAMTHDSQAKAELRCSELAQRGVRIPLQARVQNDKVVSEQTANPFVHIGCSIEIEQAQREKVGVLLLKRVKKACHTLFHRGKVLCSEDVWNAFVLDMGVRRCIQFVSHETIASCLTRHNIVSSTKWFSCNGKPIDVSRSFADYGLGDHVTLIANPRLCGGSSALEYRLYTHVLECEEAVLRATALETNKFRLQALSQQDDANPQSKVVIEQIMTLLGSLRSTLFEKHEWLLEVLENFFQIVYWFRKCDDLKDYTVCVALAHKLMTGKGASSRLLSIFGFHSELQGEFSDFVRSMRDLYTTTNGMIGKDSLLSKVRKIYTYLLVQGILQPLGLSLSEEQFLKLDAKMKHDSDDHTSMVFTIFDTAITICERVDAYMVTGEWRALVHDDMVYATWAKEADRICALAPFTSNLAAHGTTYFAFIADLNDAVEKGEAICSYTRAHSGAAGFHMKRKLDALRMLKNTEITRRASQRERDAPFGVLIHGGSSVAKSTFTKMLFYYYGKVHNLETQDHFRYVRNPADEYWSNFDSSKWCIQMDDIAFLLPSKSSEVDPTLKEMLNVVNNVPYVPPQAALEDKGKTPVVAELVLATSNAADLNAQDYFHCPLAVRRRLPLVVNIRPKQEYLAPNGKFIDPTTLPPITDSFPDYWHITVQKLVPVSYHGRDSAKLETVEEFDDVCEFLKYFGAASAQHKETQKKSATCDVGMRDISVCRLCYECGNRCTCTQGCVSFLGDLYASWFAQQCLLFTRSVLAAVLGNFASWLVGSWLVRLHAVRFFVLCVSRFLDSSCELRLIGSMNAQRNVTLKVTVRKLLAVAKLLAALYISMRVVKTASAYVQPRPKVEERDEEEEKECDAFGAQGNVFGTVETQLAKESRQNVWYNSTLELNRFDVPLAAQSVASLDSAGIRDLFAKNCVHLDITAKDGVYRVRSGGVFVRGQWLMFNRHIIEWSKCTQFSMTIITMTQAQGLHSNLTVHFTRRELVERPERDVVFLQVRNYPPVKDITKYWATTHIPVSKMVSVRREPAGCVAKVDIYNVAYHESFPVTSLSRDMPIYLGVGSETTKAGDCGALGVAHTPCGPVILGIHTLGHGCTAGFPLVTRDVVLTAVADPIAVMDGEPPTLSLNGNVQLVEPHYRSLFRYLDQGVARIYGSFPGFRARPRSKVCKTPLCEQMCKHFQYEVGFGAPAMTGWEPWKKNVVEMIRPHTDIQEDVLAKCVAGYTSDVLCMLAEKHGEDWKKELVFLSDRASVNGLPGVKFIDRMNTNTSMGHPWGTTKKKFLLPDPSPEYPEGVTFTEEIWERVAHIKSEYQQGRRVKPIFTGHLKDEATPLAKVESKKTRVFTGAPVDWSLVVRSRLLSFVRLVQKNKFIFEAGPGTACQSTEWTEIYMYLVQHGTDRIVAGDYGKFDKRMTARFVLAAFEIIVNVHRAAGFSDQELREIMCIGHDTAFPVVNMNGDLIEFFGTNPSGHPLTVIVNSIVNSLYMRYAYCLCNPVGLDCSTFKANVNLFTYGDDNIMGVNPRCEWFNHCAIQEHMATIGVEYTMADKASESVPYINIDAATFLKRRWRWDAELGAYACPLEMDSILKSLTMWIPSNTIDSYCQMVAVISSANSELFFHGREEFNRHHPFLKDMVSQDPYCHYVTDSTLPGWDALKQRFEKASEGL